MEDSEDPAVASVDRTPKPTAASAATPNGKDDKWTKFWPEAKRLGFKTSTQIHEALQVDSMKVWESAGKTLDDALIALEKIAKQRQGQQAVTDLFGEEVQ